MTDRIEDDQQPRESGDPFGWGPRPTHVRSHDLAGLMGSSSHGGPTPAVDESHSTDDGESVSPSVTEESSETSELLDAIVESPEDRTAAPDEGSAAGPDAEESADAEQELAVEEELWDTIHQASPEVVEEPIDAPGDDSAAAVVDGEVAPTIRASASIDTRKLQMLRLLLIANMVMIAIMLALPHPLETRPEYATDSAAPDPVAPPVVPPIDSSPALPSTASNPLPATRPLQLGLPDDARYEQALIHAMEGRFDEASSSLEQFLAAHPDLNPALRQLVHAHLGYYLRKAGRVSEAIEHENRMRALAGRASLPEELLESARAAERSGDGVAMRRAYAQFLLQREQFSPSMRALIEEAYLEFGDSYRVEADAGEEQSR